METIVGPRTATIVFIPALCALFTATANAGEKTLAFLVPSFEKHVFCCLLVESVRQPSPVFKFRQI